MCSQPINNIKHKTTPISAILAEEEWKNGMKEYDIGWDKLIGDMACLRTNHH